MLVDISYRSQQNSTGGLPMWIQTSSPSWVSCHGTARVQDPHRTRRLRLVGWWRTGTLAWITPRIRMALARSLVATPMRDWWR